VSKAWNLSTNQWSEILLGGFKPDVLGDAVRKANVVPWGEVLLEYTSPFDSIMDLGSGRGDNAALLALHGKAPTLVDWSADNLNFSERLFASIGASGRFCQADITKPLPFDSNSVDVVMSCGVFEYFSRDTVRDILREAFRVARKRVIIMVPNACSIPYRLGKWYMERTGQWHWGGEVPSYTLKPDFRSAGAASVLEFSVAPQHSLQFLTMPKAGALAGVYRRLYGSKSESEPALFRQGYLLVTIGDKTTH